MNNTSKEPEGGIKKSELCKVTERYNIGDLLTRHTQDGDRVKCPIIKKFRDFCLVETVGKAEAVLWVDLM